MSEEALFAFGFSKGLMTMNMMKKVLVMVLAASGLGAACAATTVSATTPEFRLSIKHDGVRASTGEESLRYSNLWDGNADATVTISQNGTPLATGLKGEGERAWSVTRNGTYALTHTTYTNGIVAKVENATFVVTGKDAPVGDLTIDWGELTFVYDGTPKCPVVTVKSGAETLTKDTDYAVSYLDNVNVGTGRVIVDGLDLYVGSRTNTFTITKASMGGGGEGGGTGGEEPGPGIVPVGGLSKFDTSFVYDGKGHTIATNELVAAFAARLGTEPFAVSYVQGVDGGSGVPALPEEPVWAGEAPAFSAVGEYAVWYRVTSANYEDFVHVAKVTITPATIQLVADGATGEYCGLGYGITVNVSTPASGYTVKYAESAEGPWLDALEYVDVCTDKPIYYQVTATGYTTATGSANVTITPKELTEDIIRLVFPSEDYVYDGTAKEPEVAAYDGDPSIITDDDWEVSFEDNVNAGTATATFTGKGNYTGTCTEEFEILPHPVTVTVVGHTASHVYDTTEKSVSGYEITAEDELYDIETMMTFTGTAAAKRTDVGTTAMGLASDQFVNGDANFDVECEVTDGGVTIAPCVIGGDPAKWDIRLDKAPMYDGTEQTAPIIQVCYVKPDGNLDNIPYTLAGHTATDAGNYTVKITGTGNYTGTVEKDWAIMPRNVKLTSGSAVWEYDGATHAETAVSVTGDGFVGEEGATYANFPQITHVSDAAEAVLNTFTYALKPNTKAQNYEITTVNGTVKMTKRPIELTAPTKSKPYDGTALTFTAAEIEAKYLGTEGLPAMAGAETFSFSSFASITEAGQTSATFSIADGTARMGDYAITVTAGATLTVQKGATEIAVTAKSGSWTYDGAAHQLHEYEATNLSTLLAGDELVVTFDEASVVSTPIDGLEQDGVVANTITSVRVIRNGADDVTANYTLAWYPGTLAVTKRPVTLTSKSDSKAYDGTALTAHEVTVGGDGFVGADGAAYSFTGEQTEKGTSDNTFAYALNEGTEAAFYAITTENGTLEVTAADITDATDVDWQVVFGPALTYTGLAQVQTIASATFKGLALDYSVTGNQQTDAGSYEMTVTGQGNFSGTHTVAWSIAPKALTLTAGSGSKVYDGAALTVGTVTADGFVVGEGASYMCDGAQTGVGSSANGVATITWNANTKGSNYAVTKVPGTLAVTPRPVTVTSRAVSKPYDGTPLTLTAADISAANVVPGESFVYSGFASRTEAGQTSATFAIAAGAGTDLANYTVTPVYGTITIAKSAAEIGVTAASESWIYDGEAHSNRTYTATNLSTLQAGDELEVTFDEASVVMTPTEGPASDGKVPNVITSVRVIRNGTDDVTANYTVAAYPGVLTVTKRPVTVTVVGHVATNTYDAVEHTVSGYEIATEDELYDIAAKTSFGGTDEVRRTDVGKSEMGLKPLDFTNSDDNFEVTYAVTDGWVSVVSADISAGEAADFVLTLGANPTYNGTVQTIPVTAVTYKGLPVTYTLAGENATHAGAYTLTVKANGNFAGEKSTTWQILKRSVTLTSGSASRVYDATPLQNAAVSVSGDGFIGLEGATYAVTGAQTDVGSSKNAFTYTLKAGTLAGDYTITTVQGDLSVTLRSVTLLSASAGKVYDGMPLVKDAVSVKPGSLGFAGSEGFAATCSGTITAVGTTPNAFTYTLANGAKAGNYAITTEYGTLTVTKATLDAGSVFPGLGTWTAENGFACTRVYNGKAQPFEVEVSADFAEEYEFLYAVTPGAWTDVAPTRKDVSEGSLKVYFRFLSPNFEPYEGFGTLRIVEKEITDEMVQPGEDAFFYDGSEKKPTVDVVHEVGGQDVCKESDYDLVYGEKADAGWWVTVTGKGNYSGTVTKIVPVLKRPVAPPVVPTRAYNGKTQKPTIPADSRWTVVANPGGIEVGEYANVVLRLTDTANYKWKGGTEEDADVTLVFAITKANNGWSRYPAMAGWEYGQTPGEPNLGQARYGTVQVAYRRVDADVSTETAARPELPGSYVARFYVEATDNFIGVTRDVAFEITGTAPDDPEKPELPEEVTALISMAADGTPEIGWTPDLSDDPRIVYTVLGKENLSDAEWTPVTDANKQQMRFFKVRVEVK